MLATLKPHILVSFQETIIILMMGHVKFFKNLIIVCFINFLILLLGS